MTDLTPLRMLPITMAIVDYKSKKKLIESLPLSCEEQLIAELKCAEECVEKVEAALKATLSESVKDTCHPDQ